MLCESRTQWELVTDTSQLSGSSGRRSWELGARSKGAAWKDTEVLGSVGTGAGRDGAGLAVASKRGGNEEQEGRKARPGDGGVKHRV